MDLEKVTSQATYLCFNINSFSGTPLKDVAGAKCRLYNTDTGAELATFTMTADTQLNCTALLMAVIYRVEGDWYMHAVGEGAEGKIVQENVDEWQAFLGRSQLTTARVAAGTAPTATVKVPEKYSPSGVIDVVLPGGGIQQVKVPGGCAGEVIEVPLVAFTTR